MRSVRKDDYDEIWAIVRSLKNPAQWMKQVAVLSPSSNLFYKYLDLKKAGQWNETTFRSVYVPQFLREMHAPAARSALNRFVQADRAGKHICLLCFCAEENLCHRSIVAGLLQGAGCSVKTEHGTDYSAYYAEYKKLR